jgi:hypothetical protein
MPEILLCSHCKQEIKSNPRLKGNQKYCGKSDCRRARRRLRQQEKMKSDQDYKGKQIDITKRWQKERYWDKYMSDYRQKNPEYVEINRQKQRKRNQTRRQSEKAEKIVKVDSLLVSPVKTNTYEMTRLKRDSSGKIVKVDSLMVQLKQIQGLNFEKVSFGG